MFILMQKHRKYIFLIKIILTVFLILFYNSNKRILFDNSYIPLNVTLEEELIYKNNYSKLIEKSHIKNNSLILEEKENLIKYLSEKNKKNITLSKTFFCKCGFRFGNLMSVLNKILFYSDIIGFNHIILNGDNFWFIKNKTYIEKYNLTIEVDDEIKYNNSINKDITYIDACSMFYYSYKIKTDIRVNYLKDEIIRNLYNVKTFPDELYIHVRSGDIFSSCIQHFYAQPPLCFYQKILNNFKFNKIILISEQKNNPVINYLLKQYPQIVYNKNSLKVDLSYLINAYNIVGSISSLVLIVLQLNENVKNVWDFNIYKNSEKIFHYHYDLYKYPHNFTIFRMEPSEYYKTKMYYWRLTMKQRYLMVNEKCENNFRIINRKN